MKNNTFAKTLICVALLQAGKSFGLEETLINEKKISGIVQVQVFKCRNDIAGMPTLPFYVGNVHLNLSELNSNNGRISRSLTFEDQSKLNVTLDLSVPGANNTDGKLLIVSEYEYRKATKVINRNGREVEIYDTFSEPRMINKRELISANSTLYTSIDACHDATDVGGIQLETIIKK